MATSARPSQRTARLCRSGVFPPAGARMTSRAPAGGESGTGIRVAEGVSDALVDGIGLAVDAVGGRELPGGGLSGPRSDPFLITFAGLWFIRVQPTD